MACKRLRRAELLPWKLREEREICSTGLNKTRQIGPDLYTGMRKRQVARFPARKLEISWLGGGRGRGALRKKQPLEVRVRVAWQIHNVRLEAHDEITVIVSGNCDTEYKLFARLKKKDNHCSCS